MRIRGEALGGFDDDRGREVEVVVGGDGVAVLGDRGDLGEGVEGAAVVELSVDDREGLNACAELRGRLAHSLGHSAHLPVLGGQQRDDAIRFAQLVGTQDDRLVSIGLHHTDIVSRPHELGEKARPASHGAKSIVKCAVTSIDKRPRMRCQQYMRN